MIPPRVRSALAYVAVYAAAGAIIPYLPLYYRSIGLTLGEVGGILALASVVGLAASPWWGSLSDRFRGSPIVLLAATVTALAGTGLLALGGERLTAFAGAAVLGAGMAGLAPMLDARALETARGEPIRVRAAPGVGIVVVRRRRARDGPARRGIGRAGAFRGARRSRSWRRASSG